MASAWAQWTGWGLWSALLALLLCRSVVGQFAREAECSCSHLGFDIEDCPCGPDSIDQFNNEELWPLMEKLLQRDFFRYYRVNMEKTCPFWADERQCSSQKCGIETCDERVPAAIRDAEAVGGAVGLGGPGQPCAETEGELDPLDTTISRSAAEAFSAWQSFDDAENKFCDADDDARGPDAHYVDLLLNPERYTGYKGDSAARVWRSIYMENCFKPSPKFDKHFLLHPTITGLCLEKRVFYRIISGLHTSITVSIAANNFKETPGFPGQGVWTRNDAMFKGRFSPELSWGEGPARLRNMYFLYLLEARALQKVGPYLRQEIFFTDDQGEDEETRGLVSQLARTLGHLQGHFQEDTMFKGARARELKEEFRLHFHNISRIMDCVDCDKCRLWGKLQMHGIGAALKILLSDIPAQAPKPGGPAGPALTKTSTQEAGEIPFQLTRNELVALFQSFGRFAANIAEVHGFRLSLAPDFRPPPKHTPKPDL